MRLTTNSIPKVAILESLFVMIVGFPITLRVISLEIVLIMSKGVVPTLRMKVNL